MGRYTLVDNLALDDRIEKDIALCRDSIVTTFAPDLLSLALTGGYGRGEGGVVKTEKGLLLALRHALPNSRLVDNPV